MGAIRGRFFLTADLRRFTQMGDWILEIGFWIKIHLLISSVICVNLRPSVVQIS
jgi:hypothetical protein